MSNIGPWRTLKYAIQQIRNLRTSDEDPRNQTTLYIRAGIYYQSDTLWLDGRDSYLNIFSYNGENVTISGGIQLNTTWNKQGDILSKEFSGSCPFEAFYGNYRLLPARGPNTEWGLNDIIAKEPYHIITGLLEETATCTRDSTKYRQVCPDSDRNGFIFNDEISTEWEHLEQTRILIFHSWIAEYAKIDKIIEENGQKKVMFHEPLKHAPVGDQVRPSGWRFLLFNNIALLDVPGEYVCVENEGMAKFSFIPPNNINDIPIISNLENILVIKSATNINIMGIQFQHSSSGGKDGYNFGPQSAVKILSSKCINIEESQFSNIGMIGLYMKNSSKISVQQTHFFDIGYHSIMMMFNDEKDKMRDVMVKDNLFNGCGNSQFWQPSCLWISGSNNISVINNEITNTSYMGVRVWGLMPYGDKYWSNNGITIPTKDDYVFHIEFNHIYDYGKGILNDFGAVYVGTSKIRCHESSEAEVRKHCYTYTHVYNNLIHDGKTFLEGATFLYSDTGSCQNTFENNIMFGDGNLAFQHHCGLDNVAKNNIIHTKSNHYIWGGCKKKETIGLQNYTNYHNIYFLDNIDVDDFQFGKTFDRFRNEAHFHNNIYWSEQPNVKNLKIFPDEKNWNEWIASGNDSASIWADPLFEDPYNRKYSIAENSPAWNLGIKQIQLDNFGIQRISNRQININ